MQRISYLLFILFIIGVIVGCGPRHLISGAEKIYLSNLPVPKSCKFLGNITNSNVHGDMYLWSSPQNLREDDINFLKNEGAKLGANVVVLVSHNIIEEQSKVVTKSTTNYETIYLHSINAESYLCQPEVLDELNSDFRNFKIEEKPLI